MTGNQKRIIAVGFALLAVSTAAVPYRVATHSELARLIGRGGEAGERTMYHPLWNTPGYSDAGVSSNDFDSATLDIGRAALIWGGIVVVTVGAVALAAPTRD